MKHHDVTIVLQGPLHNKSGSLCRGIHNIPTYMKFVGSSIISTWKNDGPKPTKKFLAANSTRNIEDDMDKYSNMYNRMNINFQIASSLNGIKEVKTKYVIKARCDERYEDLSMFIETIKANPERLITQKPCYRDGLGENHSWISDHLMGGLTVKIKDMFEKAYNRCYTHDVPHEYAPEFLLKECFDGDNGWVRMEDLGAFLFKMGTERITRGVFIETRGEGA